MATRAILLKLNKTTQQQERIDKIFASQYVDKINIRPIGGSKNIIVEVHDNSGRQFNKILLPDGTSLKSI